LYIAGGLYEKGRNLYALVIEKLELEYKRLGTENEYHDDILTCRQNLVLADRWSGNYDEAIKNATAIYQEQKAILGDRHPNTIHTKNLLEGCISDKLNCTLSLEM